MLNARCIGSVASQRRPPVHGSPLVLVELAFTASHSPGVARTPDTPFSSSGVSRTGSESLCSGFASDRTGDDAHSAMAKLPSKDGAGGVEPLRSCRHQVLLTAQRKPFTVVLRSRRLPERLESIAQASPGLCRVTEMVLSSSVISDVAADGILGAALACGFAALTELMRTGRSARSVSTCRPRNVTVLSSFSTATCVWSLRKICSNVIEHSVTAVTIPRENPTTRSLLTSVGPCSPRVRFRPMPRDD